MTRRLPEAIALHRAKTSPRHPLVLQLRSDGSRGAGRGQQQSQDNAGVGSNQIQTIIIPERIYNLQRGKLTTVASSKCFVPNFKSPLKHYVMVGSWFLEGGSVAEVFLPWLLALSCPPPLLFLLQTNILYFIGSFTRQ